MNFVVRLVILSVLASGLILNALPAAAAQLPFVGIWDCEIGLFAFSSDAYLVGRDELRIESIERDEADFLLTLPDGYRLSLFDVTETSMTWHSPASGDTFPCVRR